MVFHSPNFFVFFLLLLLPYFLWRSKRNALLAVANVIFYAASGLGMLALFLAVTLIVFGCVHLMRRPGFGWVYQAALVFCIVNLCVFKYSLFLLSSISGVFSVHTALQGWAAEHIFLPVGISFYTFHLISYLVDVRRGTTVPTPSFIKFWIYVALFPQLVAGPIMRGNELIPQLDEIEKKRIKWDEIKFGIYLFGVGLVKKVIFADPLAGIANPLFARAYELTPVESWMAAYTFGFQIYFDFSAYSDMALGIGYILGIKLVQNFNLPYISGSPSEFWKRWHISLSRWIRDYIYIGLGGSRRSPARTQFNLFAAMMLSGLWHGAMWTFVIWGALHGLLQAIHRIMRGLDRWPRIKRLRQSKAYRIAAVSVFFHIVIWTWVFFRAQSFGEAWHMTTQMAQVNWIALFTDSGMALIVALYALHLFEYVLRRRQAEAARWWHVVPFPVRGLLYAALLLVLFYYMEGDAYDFIYFQF
ncbi:MBOAT family O-acyltransferase [Saccharibacillus sp. CPCC 101409]|uniref:MBOAT family O-acyltransferase n=1 Tax=Saccharibacillus sp. CPCC 101409 TaxID=3058041 RepID=UPI0026724547|nr:MBOAT family O-acyltransferase [Saccharibacillus sp. CPCC 101409]MDO3408715.1 MBOAT family O-acyltransferase [Saccharibacillus sp. CPCC 101409]